MTADVTPADRVRPLVRAAMAATEATSGAFFERTADNIWRGVVAEGLFPPLRPAKPDELARLTTRAKLLEWAFRLPEISCGDGVFAQIAHGAQGEFLSQSSINFEAMRAVDPALAVRALIAVPVTMAGSCSGVVAVANPVGGGAFSEKDFAAVRALVSENGS